jgi:S1-C subfamily serine protease
MALAAGPARAAEPQLWSEPPARRRPPTSLTTLAERARPAVVHLRGTLPESPRGGPQQGGMISVGSGFFVSRSGYLVTNEHVVRGTVDIRWWPAWWAPTRSPTWLS